MAQVGIFSGPVLRSWTITAGGRAVQVQLSHNTLTGSYSLALDGADVLGATGSCGTFSSNAVMAFSVGPQRGTVTIINGGLSGFSYTCNFDGVGIKEDNERIDRSAEVDKLDVRVTSATVGIDETGKRVVYYVVTTKRPSDGRVNAVHRRYRDFFNMNDAVRSAYKGSQLMSSLPAPPARSFSMFVDHFDPAFIEERRSRLELFMRAMEAVPRMRSNPDFLAHLGFDDRVRETSILFPSGPLGIELHAQGEHTAIRAFARPTGEAGPAESSGRVGIGDFVSKINGESVLGMPSEVIMAKLRSAGRPLVVHFLGYFLDGTTEATVAASPSGGSTVAAAAAASSSSSSSSASLSSASSSSAATTTTDAASPAARTLGATPSTSAVASAAPARAAENPFGDGVSWGDEESSLFGST